MADYIRHYCKLFYCDKLRISQCCAYCENAKHCRNRCRNNPDKCGQCQYESRTMYKEPATVEVKQTDFVDRPKSLKKKKLEAWDRWVDRGCKGAPPLDCGVKLKDNVNPEEHKHKRMIVYNRKYRKMQMENAAERVKAILNNEDKDFTLDYEEA